METQSLGSLLRLSQVIGKAGLFPVSKSTWYRLINAGKAPKPIHYGTMAFWRRSEVDAFIATVAEGQDQEAAGTSQEPA